ncbi:hypothetical protein CGW93_03455, partial [candidate division bacterium WOR-3 4484_18]
MHITCGLDGNEDADADGEVDSTLVGDPADETDPRLPDSDNDLLKDCVDPSPYAGDGFVDDVDFDGLLDHYEVFFTRTDTNDQDTDEDGIADGFYDMGTGLPAYPDTSYDPGAGDLSGELGKIRIVWTGTAWNVIFDRTASYPYNDLGYNKFSEPGIDTVFIYYDYVNNKPDTLYLARTSLPGTDTDMDGIQDGTEMGLGPGNNNVLTDPGTGPTGADQTRDDIFVPDADQAGVATMTDPFNRDTDGDWLVDGIQEDYTGATGTDPDGVDTWQGGNRGNGAIAGDANVDNVWDPVETWTETDPNSVNTDGDNLPDEVDWAFTGRQGGALDADFDD